MPSPTLQVLDDLASRLGVAAAHAKGRPSTGEGLLVWEDEDDCDFSSFPSLSLEESPGNYHTGIFTSRGEVESHVESLLSRPILLGKQDETDINEKDNFQVDTENDSLDEFFVDRLDEVPKMMLTNFSHSFATLMNSRLRAYSTFLARHALSLAKCSKTDQEMEGVIGIEHKLETMLGIGSQISTGSVSSEFVIEDEQLTESTSSETEEGEEIYQVSLPLKMNICVNIALPHVKEDDGNETMKVTVQTTGKICGIFSRKPSKGVQEVRLLRVAEVSLNMHELLTRMTEQASRVISCIVDMTNAAFSVPLPFAPDGKVKTTTFLPIAKPLKSLAFLVNPVAAAKKRRVEDTTDEDAIVSLSPEKCATIVDCLIGELDEAVLSPPTTKRVKIFRRPAHAILNED